LLSDTGVNGVFELWFMKSAVSLNKSRQVK